MRDGFQVVRRLIAAADAKPRGITALAVPGLPRNRSRQHAGELGLVDVTPTEDRFRGFGVSARKPA